ncbi:MAG: hypothetical protein LBR22_01825 [Desulfovibrio sp.]|jgi:hypothetical protein|nr:hypothetical protein [Desulfovibrio sp.]
MTEERASFEDASIGEIGGSDSPPLPEDREILEDANAGEIAATVPESVAEERELLVDANADEAAGPVPESIAEEGDPLEDANAGEIPHRDPAALPVDHEFLEDASAGEIARRNFAAMLEDSDFAYELKAMGVSRLNFLLRKRMLVEWRALYIALWRLVLANSFPVDADDIFADFVAGYRALHPDPVHAESVTCAVEYWGMFASNAGSDFTPAARHLVSFFRLTPQQAKAMSLKLALHMRQLYKNIFSGLLGT